jgi:TPP-dependent pyruvate/acetoin dehydrogenase alpha subunit
MRIIKSGQIAAPYYSPRGQEVIPAAVSVNLSNDDYICTTYRGTHDMLAKGVPLKDLWAEIAGRIDGTSKGKGGSDAHHAPEIRMHGNDRCRGLVDAYRQRSGMGVSAQ